jgi:hypothetical protein
MSHYRDSWSVLPIKSPKLSVPPTCRRCVSRLGGLAANAGMVEAMLVGMEASGANIGEFYLPNRHLVYAAQVMTQDLYPRLINQIRDLAGGSLIMLPSSLRDWANPELAPILRKTQRSANLYSRGQGEAVEGRLGCCRLGVRVEAYAVRDVLCRRPLCRDQSQLSYFRLEYGARHDRSFAVDL